MPMAPNTPIAPIAQVSHDNPDVETLLTFAMCEDVVGAWTIIDALVGLDCLTFETAWRAMAARIAKEAD